MKTTIWWYKSTILTITFMLLASLFQIRGQAAELALTNLQPTSQQTYLNKLVQTTDSLYESMQSGNAEAARQEVDTVSQLLGVISYQGMTGVEGIHELTACVIDVRTAVYKAEPSPEDWQLVSARLRLAVDSLTHVKGALWQQYYKVMLEDLEALKIGATDESARSVKDSFAEFKNHYSLIRPAALIRKEVSSVAALDSWVSYIENLSSGDTGQMVELQKALAAGQGLLSELFGKSRDEPVLLPIPGYSNPWNWTLLIGIWILLALAYTAYRKWLGAQEEIKPAGTSIDKANRSKW